MNENNFIIKDIPDGETQHEYAVKEASMLTLILIMTHSCGASVRVHLAGRGARARIVGVAVGKDHTSIKLHTEQLHEAPDTTSSLLVKGIFSGQSTFLYDGAIRVEKVAQHTDAYQRNENLLLSREAFAESKPSLEILANDVRCTHGATISSLPKDQLWYMASRGIGSKEASNLIVAGFIQSALTNVPEQYAKKVVDKALHAL